MPQHYTFSYNHNPVFECDLASMQCEANGKTGKRCSNKTVIGVKLCWQHLLGLKHLRIKQSTVPGAGKGVFAVDPHRPAGAVIFAKGSNVMIPFDGEKMSLAASKQRYKKHEAYARYAILDSKDVVFDAACMRSVGSIIASNISNRRGASNVVYNSNKILEATRDILNGEELLTSFKNHEIGDEDMYKATYIASNVTKIRSKPKRAEPKRAEPARRHSSSSSSPRHSPPRHSPPSPSPRRLSSSSSRRRQSTQRFDRNLDVTMDQIYARQDPNEIWPNGVEHYHQVI